MFGGILAKAKEKSNANDEIKEKISKMNLTEMRSYVNNRMKDFQVTTYGLIAVMKRLALKDENTEKRYLLDDDMDSKKKKAFDLVITIATNKKITVPVIELIQEFVTVYADVILEYDKANKDIYGTRFKDSINRSIVILGEIATYQRKRGVLGD